jgi:hypothetical protein
MYRRILFVGVLPLASTDASIRASLGLVLAILCLQFFRESKPYRVQSTNMVAYAAQAVIAITFYAALAINTGVSLNDPISKLVW